MIQNSLSINILEKRKTLINAFGRTLKRINFNNNGVREINSDEKLIVIFYQLAVYLSLKCQKKYFPIILMVTASHNPAEYNGLKVGNPQKNIKISKQNIEYFLNISGAFEDLVQKSMKYLNFQSQQCKFIIGRDMRPSSSRLVSTFKDVFQLLGIKYIDLGAGSTPQIFSLSQFIFHSCKMKIKQDFRESYYEQVRNSVTMGFFLIKQKFKKQIQKKVIYLDFGNGVGAISFKNYNQMLANYFQIIQCFNSDFSRPNDGCGAEYIINHKQVAPSINQQYDEAYFFDGDSDRIIAKFSSDEIIFDGDDFNHFFSIFLKDLLENLKYQCKEQQHLNYLKQIKIMSVSNTSANQGLQHILRLNDIGFRKTAVGVQNLYRQVSKYELGCYFEPNGHGCIYMSSNFQSILNAVNSQENFSAQLLLIIYKISRNNSRGYALHNFFVLQILLFYYLNISNSKKLIRFTKHFIIEQSYQLEHPQLFLNDQRGNNQLCEPTKLKDSINEIAKKNLGLMIVVRKSNTSPLLRLTIQGQKTMCNEVFQKINQIILNYI